VEVEVEVEVAGGSEWWVVGGRGGGAGFAARLFLLVLAIVGFFRVRGAKGCIWELGFGGLLLCLWGILGTTEWRSMYLRDGHRIRMHA
jgi:hypothetical protein